MFSVGEEYTRDQIHDRLGGSKWSYLPTKDGVVVAVCLTKDMNPRAPEVVVCGRGKVIARTAAQLARQQGAIPVFLKLDTKRWEYRGDFKVVGSLDSGVQFGEFVSESGRRPSDVSLVVLLRPVKVGA